MLVKQPHLHVRANRTTQRLLFFLASGLTLLSLEVQAPFHSFTQGAAQACFDPSVSKPPVNVRSLSLMRGKSMDTGKWDFLLFLCPTPVYLLDWPEEPRKGKFPFSPTGLSTYLLKFISPLLKSAWNYRFQTLSWKKSGFITRARCWWHDPMIILPLKGKKPWASGVCVCMFVC